MGDGAMCHYCRRYRCICDDNDSDTAAQVCPTCKGPKEPNENICEGCLCIAEDAADMAEDGDR